MLKLDWHASNQLLTRLTWSKQTEEQHNSSTAEFSVSEIRKRKLRIHRWKSVILQYPLGVWDPPALWFRAFVFIWVLPELVRSSRSGFGLLVALRLRPWGWLVRQVGNWSSADLSCVPRPPPHKKTNDEGMDFVNRAP